jgi:hypothetical protein
MTSLTGALPASELSMSQKFTMDQQEVVLWQIHQASPEHLLWQQQQQWVLQPSPTAAPLESGAGASALKPEDLRMALGQVKELQERLMVVQATLDNSKEQQQQREKEQLCSSQQHQQWQQQRVGGYCQPAEQQQGAVAGSTFSFSAPAIATGAV